VTRNSRGVPRSNGGRSLPSIEKRYMNERDSCRMFRNDTFLNVERAIGSLRRSLALRTLAMTLLMLGNAAADIGAEGILPVGGVINEAKFKDTYLVQTGNPANLRFVSDPEDPGKRVLELTLGRKDPEAATSHRTEILARRDGIGNLAEVRWYGFDFYIPRDWLPNSNPVCVAQLHGNDLLRLAPPVSLQIQGSEMFLMLQYNVNPVQSATPPKTSNSVRSYPWRGPLTTGRWRHLIVRTLWSSVPGAGELDIWLDGTRVVTQRATPNTYDTSEVVGGQNYAKNGIYAPYGIGESEAIRILTRGIVFGGPTASYKDVEDALEK
jgi:hypothetical protein